MIKKTITYKDFNENMRTETFFFNINEAEATEMELSKAGGLSERLKKIVEKDDRGAMYQFFKRFILKAYGVKSDDGRSFLKTEGATRAFEQSRAFVVLMKELSEDETGKAASEFFNNVLDFVPAKSAT